MSGSSPSSGGAGQSAAASSASAEAATMPGAASNARVDADRLWDSIHSIARFGPGISGGSNRQALTEADGEARAQLREWGERAGLSMSVDRIGNMFLRREGAEAEADAVYFGSHLDTQPTGGRYDGVLGTLSALEIMRTLDDLGLRTIRPLVLVNWTNEEGTRFAPPLLGSGTFAGVFDIDWAHDRLDSQGIRSGEALRRIGWMGEEKPGERKVHAFFELHIEQGPILEAEEKDIGVVTHGQGVRWLECRVSGRESHAGSTPMGMRRDALLGMARIVDLVHLVAMDNSPDAVGTVGRAEAFPNSANVIAGEARFTIDLRSPSLERLEAMSERMRCEAKRLCEAMGLSFESETAASIDPPLFDSSCVDRVRSAAERLGYSHRDIVSGAGHDACMISLIAPTAMVMCPCEGGLSHNEGESIAKEWASKGADVLLHAVLESAGIAK